MHKRIWIIVAILLAAGATLCAIRWKAWFGNPPEPEWTGPVTDYHFLTFGEEKVPSFTKEGTTWQDMHQPHQLQILLFGDVHGQIDHERYLTLGQRYPDLDAYAQSGDWMDRGYYYYAQELKSNLKGTAFENLPVITTPGNHEYHKGLIYKLPLLWYSLFKHPLNGPANGLGSTYYVDFTSLRFVVIDTSAPYSLVHYTRLNKWVKQTFASAGDKFIVVMMHHPVLSTAKGQWNNMTFLFLYRSLKHASLVFAGHDHVYRRHLPFVEISSVDRPHTPRTNVKAEKMSQQPVYVLLTVTDSSLVMQTYDLRTDSLIDEVLL